MLGLVVTTPSASVPRVMIVISIWIRMHFVTRASRTANGVLIV